MAVDADPGAGGPGCSGDVAGGGPEVGIRVFRVDPHLDGMAVKFYIFLKQHPGCAGGDQKLLFNQVEGR